MELKKCLLIEKDNCDFIDRLLSGDVNSLTNLQQSECLSHSYRAGLHDLAEKTGEAIRHFFQCRFVLRQLIFTFCRD
ncbi:hypothetical protein DPU24_20250 [Salmonella enterica subsp. enterica serovar Oranienburg]|nr:hypothetical protein [Salmonella enterica subsp. enterica serovar Oranienburg]